MLRGSTRVNTAWYRGSFYPSSYSWLLVSGFGSTGARDESQVFSMHAEKCHEFFLTDHHCSLLLVPTFSRGTLQSYQCYREHSRYQLQISGRTSFGRKPTRKPICKFTKGASLFGEWSSFLSVKPTNSTQALILEFDDRYRALMRSQDDTVIQVPCPDVLQQPENAHLLRLSMKRMYHTNGSETIKEPSFYTKMNFLRCIVPIVCKLLNSFWHLVAT